MLGENATALDQWLGSKLRPFQDELGQTIDLVRRALQDGKFDLVDNVFSRATASRTTPQAPGLPEPGTAFQEFLTHLSYLWLREYVQEQKERLRKQKEHKDYLDWGFDFEVETMVQVDELERRAEEWRQSNKTAGTPLQDQFDNFITDLRVSLMQGRYPLERIFHRLIEMQTEEKDDVCGLQAQLNYQDSETRMRYKGLKQIEPVLQAKIQQIGLLRNWLAERGILVPGATVQQRCLGIADWDNAKEGIGNECDAGKFDSAFERCRDIREGLGLPESGNPFTRDGLWPLERARRELGLLPIELGTPVSKVIRVLLAQRERQLAELDRQIKECAKREEDIKERKGRQHNMQKEIEELFADLSNAENSLPFGRDQRVQNVKDEIRRALAIYREQVCKKDKFIQYYEIK
jgi:hypothetical protein